MSDFDERDPFPEASVPEAGAPSETPAASAPPSGSGAAEPLQGAPEPSTAPEPVSAPATDAPEAPSAVPPSEAPTIPMIPVEKLRFHTADSRVPTPAPSSPEEATAAASPTAAERTDAAPAAPAAVPSEPVRRVSPPPPPRPAGPASADPMVTVMPPPASRDLSERRQPLYRECRGYRLRLDPPDLTRLRELPGSRGKSDDEIGEAFFDGQADRLAASIAGDVPTPSEIRVVVDPYSRQAFLALENRIRGILSF